MTRRIKTQTETGKKKRKTHQRTKINVDIEGRVNTTTMIALGMLCARTSVESDVKDSGSSTTDIVPAEGK